MAWGRIVKLEARTADGVVAEVSKLRIDARCTRSRVFDDNSFEATIHNANDDTINKFLQRGTNIALYAGYDDEGEPGLMYQGNIIESKTYRSGTETITVIRSLSLRSLKRPFTCTPVSLAFGPGSNAGQILDSIGSILGLVLIGREMASDVVFDSGWNYVGMVSGAIKRLRQDLRTKGLGLYTDLAELVVYSFETYSTYTMAAISPNTGLLNLQDTTDYMGAARENISSLPSKMEETETVKEKKIVSTRRGKKEKIVKKKIIKTGKLKVGADEILLTPENTDDMYAILDKVFTNMKKTYTARTIVLPKVKPNSLVHVKYDGMGVNGLFVVDSMEIAVGNGKDSSFAMELKLVEA